MSKIKELTTLTWWLKEIKAYLIVAIIASIGFLVGTGIASLVMHLSK